MRNVLIIAELSHASPRIPGIAKYLPIFGWNPIILTGTLKEDLDNAIRVAKTPYVNKAHAIKRALGLDPQRGFQQQIGVPLAWQSKKRGVVHHLLMLAKSAITYPDQEKGWKSIALIKARDFLRKERVDVILSSSSPITAHLIAKELKIKYGVPWIADFRDLWSQNHNYPYGAVRQFFDRRLEKKTMVRADALITVSSPWSKKLQNLHKKHAFTITNGFDPTTANIPPTPLTRRFTITYTGQVYQGKQNISKFFCALKKFAEGKMADPMDIEVRLYGPLQKWIQKEIEVYHLESLVKQYGIVARTVALQKQRESQVSLLLNWEDPYEKGTHTGKIFEYLSARRPILSVGGWGGDVVEHLLEQTKAGIYAPSVAKIKASLSWLYQEYKQKGSVSFHGDQKEINAYNYKEIAKKFASVLNKVTISYARRTY